MKKWLTLAALGLMCAGYVNWSGGMDGPITNRVLSGEMEVDPVVVDRFRLQGPRGFQLLLASHVELLKQSEATQDNSTRSSIPAIPGKTELTTAERAKRLEQWIDAVGGAKYCSKSQMYWYTDLDQAKAAAKRENKPILSLRMLGKLTDDFSCANSRFFRTTLYANTEISSLLREKYILHWKSVRPVPKITIDFGDGRTIERTVTGNSIHYVMLADGTIVDALPGLYGPQAFRQKIESLAALCKLAGALEGGPREEFLVSYHRRAELAVGSSRVDLQACKLEYSIVSPK